MLKPTAWFLPLHIAWRYGFLHKNSALTQFIALMAWLSICLGVALLTLVLSVMNGFDQELRQRILALVPQASIQSYDYFSPWQALREDLERQSGVVSAAPFIHMQGMLNTDNNVQPSLIYAVDIDLERRVSDLAKYTQASALDALATPVAQGQAKPLILGRNLAAKLKLNIGDKLSVIIPEPGHNGRISPKIEVVYLAGLLDSGTELDQHLALMSLSQAQNLMQLGDRIQGIRLKVEDIFKAGVYARVGLSAALEAQGSQLQGSQLQGSQSQSDFYVRDWSQSHGNLYHAIAMSKKMVVLLMFLIIGVAAFNVVTCLVMIVKDKTPDIAILRTMGMSAQAIKRIFIGVGMSIGLSGIAVGLMLGVVFASYIGDFFQLIQSLSGKALLDSRVYPISYLPSDIRWPDLAMVALVTFVLALIATWLPAKRAAAIAPAQVLRHE